MILPLLLAAFLGTPGDEARLAELFDGRAPASGGVAVPVRPERSAEPAAPHPGFELIEIDPRPGRPAFVRAADLDGDGAAELLVSRFDLSSPVGAGGLDVYRMRRKGDLSAWDRERLLGGVKFPNHAEAADVDGDGDLDILVPSGFLACAPGRCGGLSWLERGDGGWVRHPLVENGALFYHKALLADMDGDGVRDLLTVGERKGLTDDGRAEVQYFRGTPEGFDRAPRKIADGLGSLPVLRDIDGDGDLDIASAEYFGSKGSFVWLERREDGSWERHVMDDSSGKAIQLSFIEDLYGDGLVRAVGANHTNTSDAPSAPESGVFVFDPPADPKAPWAKRRISEGIRSRPSHGPAKQGAPGVFSWGDVDGDGDIDIVVHGDGDPRVYWLEQVSPGSFRTSVLVSGVPQGAAEAADFDGDGRAEVVVSSYESNRLFLLKKRAASPGLTGG